MEFDKSRVYTVLNADELKVGSKVIVGDTLTELKENVEDNSRYDILEKIFNEDYLERFNIRGGGCWSLAYLVEPPEEKVLKWTDLKIGDIIKKKDGISKAIVTRINERVETLNYCHIFAGDWLQDKELRDWEKVE